MYERLRANVEDETRPIFTFTRDTSWIAPVLITGVKFAYVRTLKLRDSENPPYLCSFVL